MLSSYYLLLILIPAVSPFFPSSPSSWNLTFNTSWYSILTIGHFSNNSTYMVSLHVRTVYLWADMYTGFTKVRNCSGPMFSPSTPIGYGICSTLPFANWTYTEYCIFTGYYPNATILYSVCKPAVNASLATNTAPSQPAWILPNLTTPINCADSSLPMTYYVCYSYNDWISYNQTACTNYFSSNLFLCQIYYDPYNVSGYTVGLGMAEANEQLNNVILSTVAMNYSTSTGVTYRLFESTTSVLLAVPILLANNVTYYACYCFCRTNMCNTNIETCSAGTGFNCTMPTFIGRENCIIKRPHS